MSEKTIFQKIIDKEIPAEVLYEDEQVFVFLDAFPVDKGHTLVIPKKPYVCIWDMPAHEYMYLQSIVQRVAHNMREMIGKDIAIFQRNGRDAGQEVMHLHVHLVPRFNTEHTKPIFSYADPETKVYESEEEKQSFAEKLSLS